MAQKQIIEDRTKFRLFLKSAQDASAELCNIPKSKNIRIVSHLDADGIAAAAIIMKALAREKRPHSVSIVHNLDDKAIRQLKNEGHEVYIFTDIGSGQIDNLEKYLKDKKIFILDHHNPQSMRKIRDFVHFNPHIFDIDGTKSISGAGVVYFFARALDRKNTNMAHIAIVGAIGDLQERNGFEPLNRIILKDAVKAGMIEVQRGLKFFGARTKALHKVLGNTMDPYIPGISGSEANALKFLKEIDIDPKRGNTWKKLVHLRPDELKRLIEAIIKRRMDEENPEDILGNVYILAKEEKESPTRDAREFATLLNSCGRMGRSSLGIGTCLGDKNILKKAVSNMGSYKRELVNALKWYESEAAKKSNSLISKKRGYLIINAQDNIVPTLIGTVSSMISKSGKFNEFTFILSMAQHIDGYTKISLRFSPGPKGQGEDKDLREILDRIIKRIGGESGGHKKAAGAVIPTKKENDFIKQAKSIFDSELLEESIS